MKGSLLEHVRILDIVEHQCWCFYTHEIEQCKSAGDELGRSYRLSSHWATEPNLFNTLQETLLTVKNLTYMEIPFGESDMATKALTIAWTLVGKRVWTMSKHSSPPDCYAKLLRTEDEYAGEAQTVATTMKTHHKNILSLETARNTSEAADEVWDACLFLNMQPVRLMLEYFKRDKYSSSSREGRHLLMGLLCRLPDNKIVEDIHAPLRLATKGNSNDRLSAHTMQDVINHSTVIESRGIPHNVKVSQDHGSS